MSLLEEYMTSIKPRIDAAIHDALQNEIADGLCDAIKESARTRVYDPSVYEPSPEHEAERRYELGDRENLEVFVGENSVEIKNYETLRHHPDVGEVAVVEEGTSYGQPFPRPFMEPALQDYVGSGKAEAALEIALRAAGFDVENTYDPYTAREDELPF